MAKVTATQSAGRRDNIELPMKTGETFLSGALVVLDGTPEVTECGADPASVYGVAEDPAGKNVQDPTKVIVGRATEEARWWFPCSADPAAANVGVKYGAVKDADGVWCVDLSDTTNDVFYVHQVDTATKRAEVSIIAAVRQVAP